MPKQLITEARPDSCKLLYEPTKYNLFQERKLRRRQISFEFRVMLLIGWRKSECWNQLANECSTTLPGYRPKKTISQKSNWRRSWGRSGGGSGLSFLLPNFHSQFPLAPLQGSPLLLEFPINLFANSRSFDPISAVLRLQFPSISSPTLLRNTLFSLGSPHYLPISSPRTRVFLTR